MNITALLCFIATIIGYILAKKLYRRYPYMLLSPAMLVPFVLILILLGFHISYDTYMTDNHWIVIYEYRQLIREHLFSIALGIVIGMSAGVISAFYLAKLFHFDSQTTYSLMSRSISTPFAMELTAHIGGSVELVILFTMITGIAGVLLGDGILLLLKLNSAFAQGASLGNAAHGFGTSKAFMRHHEEGVIASLTMVLAGVFMVILGPSLIHLVLRCLG